MDTLFVSYYRKDSSEPKALHDAFLNTAVPQEHPDYLPTLGCTLPLDWKVEPVISAIVANDDDAEVHTHMWDNRIYVLYLSFTSTIINVFKIMVLIKIFKGLYKEFVEFYEAETRRNLVRFGWRRRLFSFE